MDGRQEILDVFDGCPGDGPAPPAIFTQTGTVGQMDACGAAWPEANYDADQMVTLALQPSALYGFHTARVPFCITVEAERLGAEIRPGSRDTQPSVVGSPYSTPEGFLDPPDSLMGPDEFVSGGRCATVIEAATRLSREHPDLFVTAGMQDPMAAALMLLGTENAIMGSMLEPDRLEAWVRAVYPLSEAYARALSEVADNVLFISASVDLMPPETVLGLDHPYLRRALAAVRSHSTVHVCGNSMPVLDDLASLGADGLSLEASHDPEGMLETVGGRCLMFGSVDPVRTLLSGTPGLVISDAIRYDKLGFDVITPECGVPPHTPGANLSALAHYREHMRGRSDGGSGRI